jgi:hypothetical protein
VNHLNLGYTLCSAGSLDEGARNLIAAFTLYPEYLELDETLANLREHEALGQLSEELLRFMAAREVSIA